MQNCVVKGYFRFCCCDFSEFEFIIIHWCFLLFSKIFHFVMVCFRCTGTLDILAYSQFCLLFFLLPSLSVVRSSFPSLCSWFYCCHFLPLVFGIIVFFSFLFFYQKLMLFLWFSIRLPGFCKECREAVFSFNWERSGFRIYMRQTYAAKAANEC